MSWRILAIWISRKERHIGYRRVQRVDFPRGARFFSDWEKAKDWLVDEVY